MRPRRAGSALLLCGTPTHDLVVVRLGHDAGEDSGNYALKEALELLMQAVPQVREPRELPATSK